MHSISKKYSHRIVFLVWPRHGNMILPSTQFYSPLFALHTLCEKYRKEKKTFLHGNWLAVLHGECIGTQQTKQPNRLTTIFSYSKLQVQSFVQNEEEKKLNHLRVAKREVFRLVSHPLRAWKIVSLARRALTTHTPNTHTYTRPRCVHTCMHGLRMRVLRSPARLSRCGLPFVQYCEH